MVENEERRTSMTDQDDEAETLLSRFDSLCVSFGDYNALSFLVDRQSNSDNSNEDTGNTDNGVSYLEIQLLSQSLAAQMHYRFRPDYVLVDGRGHAAAEAVALLACMRLQVPFVPVDSSKSHLIVSNMVNTLLQTGPHVSIVAVTVADSDLDVHLGVFYQAQVHRILMVDWMGNLQEQLAVPQTLPLQVPLRNILQNQDALYVLFTSGTSGNTPKAVVGSQTATHCRLEWFRTTFSPACRVARRTPLTFVDGVNELLGALLEPESLLVTMKDPEMLQAMGMACFFQETLTSPTQITLLPSQLEQLMLLFFSKNDNSSPLPGLKSLQRIIVSGEPCSERLFRKVRELLPACQFINLYGQTETTGDVLYSVLSELDETVTVVDGIVAVGKPILSSIQCTLTNKTCHDGNKESSYQQGEIVVSGNLISLGYLQTSQVKPLDTTWESFATGDIGFCQGGIYYIKGRKDDVVKIHGVWTSPLEIEAALTRVYPTLSQAAATILNGSVYAVVCTNDETWNYSREVMHKAGLPWSLIPEKCVCIEELPTSRTGASKIDRTRLVSIVQELLLVSPGENASTTKRLLRGDEESLLGLVATVLNISSIDRTKSFIELGGNSATAISLLYELKNGKTLPKGFNSVDILAANDLIELEAFVNGEKSLKRRKLPPSESITFHPRPSYPVSEGHEVIPFLACVDATPVLIDEGKTSSFYIGCQGGVLQRIAVSNGCILATKHFPGWMIQADILVVSDAVIVCGHKRKGKGFIASVGLDLDTVNCWHDVDYGVISTPIVLDECTVQVQAGMEILRYNVISGKELRKIYPLPAMTTTRALVAGDSTVYFSSDYECDELMVLPIGGSEFRVLRPIGCNAIGPINKDPSIVNGNRLLFADSWGFLHSADTTCWEGISYHVDTSPLGPPTMLTQDTILVGSYDGYMHCLKWKSDVFVAEWTVCIGSTIYGKPLAVTDSICIVCTTAGHVVHVVDGEIMETKHIAGEIWSDPLLLELDEHSFRIAFGARDSNVHIVTFSRR